MTLPNTRDAPLRRGSTATVIALVAIAAIAALVIRRAGEKPPWPGLRERRAALPPWFGDPVAAPVRVSGVVHAPRLPVTVRLAADVADPAIWPGVEVTTDRDGRFD